MPNRRYKIGTKTRSAASNSSRCATRLLEHIPEVAWPKSSRASIFAILVEVALLDEGLYHPVTMAPAVVNVPTGEYWTW